MADFFFFFFLFFCKVQPQENNLSIQLISVHAKKSFFNFIQYSVATEFWFSEFNTTWHGEGWARWSSEDCHWSWAPLRSWSLARGGLTLSPGPFLGSLAFPLMNFLPWLVTWCKGHRAAFLWHNKGLGWGQRYGRGREQWRKRNDKNIKVPLKRAFVAWNGLILWD